MKSDIKFGNLTAFYNEVDVTRRYRHRRDITYIYIYMSPLPVLKIFERTSRKLNEIKSDSLQDTIRLAQSSTLDWVDR